MLRRGEQFLDKLMDARPKIAKLAVPFLTDGSASVQLWSFVEGRFERQFAPQKVLVHSHSKCVLEALKEAAKANRRLHVFSTQSSFDESGIRMQGRLPRQLENHILTPQLFLQSLPKRDQLSRLAQVRM